MEVDKVAQLIINNRTRISQLFTISDFNTCSMQCCSCRSRKKLDYEGILLVEGAFNTWQGSFEPGMHLQTPQNAHKWLCLKPEEQTALSCTSTL